MIRTIFKLNAILIIAIFLLTCFLGFNQSNILAEGDSKGLSAIGGRKDNYELYLQSYEGSDYPDETIVVEGGDYADSEPKAEVLENFEGSLGKSVKTLEEGYVEWHFDIKKAGLYNIKIEYFPIEGRSSSIEREITINEESPFFAAKHMSFTRVWKDANEIKRDNRDNDLRPSQIESPRWETAYFDDYMGYYTEPYYFYFKEGKNTLRMTAVKEPMVIKSITIHQAERIPTYEEVKKRYKEEGYKEVKNQKIEFEAEKADFKSDPTLYPIYDRTSPATSPYHPSKIRLNTIGGYRWNQPGMWISWKFYAPESGLYKINLKARQNIVRGLFTNRRLSIDGRVPFKEVEALQFNYKNKWVMYEIGNQDEPYLFYLEEGWHELKLETTLGDLTEIIRVAEDSVLQLNAAYRKIIMIISSNPDQYTDYQLDVKIPDVLELMADQGRVMESLSEKLREYTGQRGSHAVLLDKLAYQLKDLAKNPHTIQRRLDELKGNVGALGTWILQTREQPLELDYIIISSTDETMPKADVGFFKKLFHEIRSFFASFKEDYDSIGNVHDKKEAVTVWIMTGRDQAQVLKEMIDDTFTPQTDIPVNVQLVQDGVLLPATVAKRGPDVAMQVGGGEPVNYAIRNALKDLTEYPDFDEISKRFHDSALEPYRFNNGVFGLPETQSFPMLFCRTDILEELGLPIPETWEDVYDILPYIQKNHMDIGIDTGLGSYLMLLYQNGGEMYQDGGIASNFDSEEAIMAFRKWTELYVSYKFPLQYDFINRFRIGEIPIGIADYTTYNALAVSAPEIRGLWEFVPLPGTVKEGAIDRAAASSGTAAILLKSAKNHKQAWEYMKWWTSAETQERFGREMESLLGASARYNTANIEALQKLPWPVKDYKNLLDQWEWVVGIPEVPGGYFTPRHINNAFRKVVYQGEDPRETLLDYVRVINEEITNKRKEFGLDTRTK